jgi:hypothetical protein
MPKNQSNGRAGVGYQQQLKSPTVSVAEKAIVARVEYSERWHARNFIINEVNRQIWFLLASSILAEIRGVVDE